MAQIYRGHYSPAMHAGDRTYWKYAVADSLLSLDTKTMAFSDVLLPPGVTHQSAYSVGETEDGTCCLVHVFKQVPLILERQVPLILDSVSAYLSVDQVRAIVGGIVLLCVDNWSSYQHHIAFRLKSLKVEADFTCRGLARPFVIK